MEALLISALTIGVLVGAPFVAHLSGWLTSRFLRVESGAIREWMPSIPDHVEDDGRAEVRWERRRRAIEAKLLSKFADGVTGAEAHALAAELGEDPEVVAGALGHMREEIPTRLRVTRSGKLLHDFDGGDIRSLRNRRRMGWPIRVVIFALGALANLGAAWPVLMGLLVAVGALGVIALEGGAAVVGGAALLIVASLFGLNVFAGWLTHLVLTPGLGMTSRPKLGPTLRAEQTSAALEEEQAAGWSMLSGSSRSKRKSRDADLSGCSGIGDVGEGGAAAIVVVLLLAVVAACTFALYVFLRGIWRAATGAGMPSLDVSPTQWVRSTQPNDSWERFMPTNDLVLRVMRVMRRLVSHTHPRDATIVGRIMARAGQQDGRISALEIALQEGLDLDSATAIGARLSGRAGGRIDVTDGGELDFVFPSESLTQAPATWDDDLHAEYIDYDPADGSVRRRMQQGVGLPVNLPGIAWSHVTGASRLAAGTVLMMLTGVAVVTLVPGVPLWTKLLVDSVLPLMAIGTFALAGSLRYATSTLASHGARRDIRRAVFLHINRALERGESEVRLEKLRYQLRAVLGSRWLTDELVRREIVGVAVDLDLEPIGADETYALTNLIERRIDVDSFREAAQEVELEFDVEDGDDVVFDSQIEHDRIRVLA